jgi:hypothetical protein
MINDKIVKSVFEAPLSRAVLFIALDPAPYLFGLCENRIPFDRIRND